VIFKFPASVVSVIFCCLLYSALATAERFTTMEDLIAYIEKQEKESRKKPLANIAKEKGEPSRNSQTHIVSIGGGGGVDSTTENMVFETAQSTEMIADAFSIPFSQRQILLGETESNICYSKTNTEQEKKIKSALQSFTKSGDCQQGKAVFDAMLGEGLGELSVERKCVVNNDFNQDGRSEISGPANRKKVTELLNSFPGKAGDHVILSFSGHGSKPPPDFRISTSDGSYDISKNQIADLQRKLEARGVFLHLNNTACYGGGFNDIGINKNGESSRFSCSVSAAAPDRLGYASDLVIKKTFDASFHKGLAKFGNQFSAFACANSNTVIGSPQTTLDEIVRASKLPGKPIAGPIQSQCASSGQTSWQVMEKLKKEIENSYMSGLRKDLAASYLSEYISAVKQCQSDNDDEKKIVLNAKNCVREFTQDPLLRMELIGLFSDAASQRQLKLLDAQINFFEKADPKQLQNYLRSYCCLTYNFQKKESLPLCKKYGV
jgi:hypothetical protein